MSVKRKIKHLVWKWLPGPSRRALVNRHYVKLVGGMTPSGEPDLLVARRLAVPGSVAFDVGANVGIYTRVLSETVGLDGAVHSFEPLPSTFGILSHVRSALRLENVTLHHAAASNAAGMCSIELPKDSDGLGNHYLARIGTGTDGTAVVASVAMVKLDDVAIGSGSVTFIKIDTEGHEANVIAGAMELIARHLPALLVEVSSSIDDPTSDGGRVRALLSAHGYLAYRHADGELRPWATGDHSVNVVFLRPEHVARFSSGASVA